MELSTEWQEKEYIDLDNAAQSNAEAACELTAFEELVKRGKRPIIERRVVGRQTIEYQVRDRDA